MQSVIQKRSRLYSAYTMIFIALWISYPAITTAGEFGGQPGEITRYGVGARPLSMGGAFVGLADDVNSIFYNPAGLADVDSAEITFMHYSNDAFTDDYYSFMAVTTGQLGFSKGILKTVFGENRSSFGLAALYHRMNEFERRDAFDKKLEGDFHVGYSAYYFTYSRLLLEISDKVWTSTGASLKFNTQSIIMHDHSWEMDIGLKSRINDLIGTSYMQIGGCLQNISDAKINNDRIPPSLSLGLNFGLINTKKKKSNITEEHRNNHNDNWNIIFNLDFVHLYSNINSYNSKDGLRFGIETDFFGFDIRAGIRSDHKVLDFNELMLGTKINYERFDFDIGMAFRFDDYYDHSPFQRDFVVSITWLPGKLIIKKDPKVTQDKTNDTTVISSGQEQKPKPDYNNLFTEAVQYIKNGDTDSAKANLEIVAACDNEILVEKAATILVILFGEYKYFTNINKLPLIRRVIHGDKLPKPY